MGSRDVVVAATTRDVVTATRQTQWRVVLSLSASRDNARRAPRLPRAPSTSHDRRAARSRRANATFVTHTLRSRPARPRRQRREDEVDGAAGNVVSAREARSIVAQTAEALAHCLACGVVHRDVKPEVRERG